jgi:hypothetical protein
MRKALSLWLLALAAVPAWSGTTEVPRLETPISAAGAGLNASASSLDALALPAVQAPVPLESAVLGTPASLPAAAQAAAPAEAAKAQAVSAFIAAAREGARSQTAEAFVARAPALFDGLAPEHRDHALEALEAAAIAEPKNAPLRHALQRLLIRDELRRVEPLLRGKELTPEREADVLGKTEFADKKWYHSFWDEVTPVPEGIARREDLSIGLNVKSGWRKLPSFSGHFRTIFSHEYTHRLQFEGEATESFGMEIPAVATEMLRGIELFGLKGLEDGVLTAIGQLHLGSFEDGRAWARSGAGPHTGFFYKGYLAGAAYELARITGRWADAWLFNRLINSGVAPSEARARVLDKP